jgi:S1-C subfamily serine protease
MNEPDFESLTPTLVRSSRQARAARRRRRTRRALASTAAVMAGIGGAGALGAFTPTTASAPAVARPVSQHQLSADAIAKQSDSAIVDITTRLTNGEAAGTGIVLTSNGEILTNYHVIQGASSISVRISNSSESYAAKVIGTDPADDVALIKARGAKGLATLHTGDSSKLNVGDRVVAIGNALARPGPPTVTEGEVTALHRSITVHNDFGDSDNLSNLLEIDAQLEPGNSGGPLFNAAGKVVGVNAAVEAPRRFSTSSTSNGYAIPINDVMTIVRQIETGNSSGKVQVGPRGYLGVQIRNRQQFDGGGGSGSNGVLIVAVAPNGAADSAGIVVGDVVVSIGGTQVGSTSEIAAVMRDKKPGQKVAVKWIDANGQQHTATVQLGVSPIA